MNPRFLLLVRTGSIEWSALVVRASRVPELVPAIAQPRFALFAAPGGRWLKVGEDACIVGTLFHRHGPARPVSALEPEDAERIGKSRGDVLPGAYWGGYVAAFADQGSARVLRDPSGALPCYFVVGPGYAAFASDAELLVDAGLSAAEVDWDALARHFLAGGVPTWETSLRGIKELLPGFSLDLDGDVSQAPCWSPWDHVSQHGEDDAQAAERLSRIIGHCVRSWAAGRGPLLVSVSGGLDSSIVTAALAEAGADLVCLTMFGEDRSGDERVYARALAEHLGLQLLERSYHLDHIDIRAPIGAHLPRTKDRTHALSYEHIHMEVAAETGAGAFVTGNGGDSLFGYSQSAAAVADRYLREGLGMGVLRSLRDVCLQTGCSYADAALGAWRVARGPRRYRPRMTPIFLDPDRLASLTDPAFDHPWLDAPDRALPGKAAHIAAILRVQQCFEPHRSRWLPVINPLMSQPVMEACLAVPSWQWRSGGRDRALARRAFAGKLPAVILQRRAKGGPDGFAARILDTFRDSIRERLLDGHLVRRRIADRPGLEGALRQESPTLGVQRVRIFEFLAAEAWVDAWIARRGKAGT